MKNLPKTPERVLASLEERLSTVHLSLEEIWKKQASLREEEASLELQRKEIEQSMVLIQREFGLKLDRPASVAQERQRTRTKFEARLAARRTSSSPRSLADAIDRVLQESVDALTAAEIHEKVAARPGARSTATVADVRVALSRYSAGRGWNKVSEQRPLRWRAGASTALGKDGGGPVK